MLYLLWRAGDGAFQNPVADLPVSTVPGLYTTVPPFDFVFAPFWANMQLFWLKAHDQVRAAPPPALTSPAYTKILMK